ncbi:unnamed protein product [Coregonus sp. 'balchen']|nr:unnamed protein product [Coregonus sp. 'balchen']
MVTEGRKESVVDSPPWKDKDPLDRKVTKGTRDPQVPLEAATLDDPAHRESLGLQGQRVMVGLGPQVQWALKVSQVVLGPRVLQETQGYRDNQGIQDH